MPIRPSRRGGLSFGRRVASACYGRTPSNGGYGLVFLGRLTRRRHTQPRRRPRGRPKISVGVTRSRFWNRRPPVGRPRPLSWQIKWKYSRGFRPPFCDLGEWNTAKACFKLANQYATGTLQEAVRARPAPRSNWSGVRCCGPTDRLGPQRRFLATRTAKSGPVSQKINFLTLFATIFFTLRHCPAAVESHEDVRGALKTVHRPSAGRLLPLYKGKTVIIWTISQTPWNNNKWRHLQCSQLTCANQSGR